MSNTEPFGPNEKKLVYVCSKCGKFRFITRAIGNEAYKSSRRIHCDKCGEYTIAKLET